MNTIADGGRQMQKTEWQRPCLRVIARSGTQEQVLDTCKSDTGGFGAASANNQCQVVSGCLACYSFGVS
jgi:hypothetical protein